MGTISETIPGEHGCRQEHSAFLESSAGKWQRDEEIPCNMNDRSYTMKSKILVPTISLILAILFTWTFAAAQASAEEVTLSLEDVTVNNEVSTTVDMRVIVDKPQRAQPHRIS